MAHDDRNLQQRVNELEQRNAYLARSNLALARMLCEAHEQIAAADHAPPSPRLQVVKDTIADVVSAVAHPGS